MDTTQSEETILKTDVLGRVKTPPARREELLDEFEGSGVSGKKFAELVGIKYQTFATWAQKRRRRRGAYPALKAPAAAGWLEAVVEQRPPAVGPKAPGLTLELPGGARLEIGDAHQAKVAAALLRALAQS